MDGRGHLQAGDAEAVVELIGAGNEDDPGLSLPAAVFDGLQNLFPGSHIYYQVTDVVGRRVIWIDGLDPGGTPVMEGESGPDEAELDAYFFEVMWRDPMCSAPLLTGDRRTILLSSDYFPTQREWRGREFTREFCPEITSVMSICLPSQNGFERRVSLGHEDGAAFAERDRQVAELIRPHLQEIWLSAERRRAGVPALTPREREVLGLVASGLTHAEIASRLVISVSTVHKHMEHVRERVGVRTAAAAAAIALPFAPAPTNGRRR
ncbi:MAG: helix-turn-helix transcriptional regulator [Cellulomonas sp.]